jgi:hypothetical protein
VAADGRPRRDFGSNSLDSTIPAALSALNSLRFLCVRPARNAAPLLRCVNRAPCRCCAAPFVSAITPASYRARILAL